MSTTSVLPLPTTTPARHRPGRTAVVLLLLVLLAGLGSAPMLFSHFSDGDVAVGTQAQRADRIEARLRPDPGTALVLSAGPGATARLRGLTGVGQVQAVAASPDRRDTLVQVTFRPGQDGEGRLATAERVEAAVAGSPVLSDDLAARDIDSRVARDLPRAEAIGLAFALLVLTLTLGWRAALVPLLTGLTAVLGALPLLLGCALVLPVSSPAVNIVTMLGLGLGLDYGLLLLARYRDLRRQGQDHDRSVQLAAQRAGRTVLWSAATVAATLSALLLFRDAPFVAVSVGGLCATAAAVLAARTLAPALLATWGPRMRPGRRRTGEGGFGRLAVAVQARPGPVVLVGGALLVLLALPAVGARFLESDANGLPSGSPTRQAAAALAARVPGFGQATVDVVAPSEAAMSALLPALRSTPGVRSADADGRTATVRVVGDPQGPRATAVVEAVRARAPRGVLVGGDAALRLDHVRQLGRRLPLVVVVLGLLTGLLVFAMTRSRRQAVVAVLLALLSQGATLGVLALAFGRSLVIYAPVIAAALAFALSVDYLVFLLHRARELRADGSDELGAVRGALASTGSVITLAAVLFSGVSIGFAGTSLLLTRQIGVALLVGVLLDATLVRCLLLPAALALGSRPRRAHGLRRAAG